MGLVSFLQSSKSVSKLLWLPHARATTFPYIITPLMRNVIGILLNCAVCRLQGSGISERCYPEVCMQLNGNPQAQVALTLSNPVITIHTTFCNIKKHLFCPHSMYICIARSLQQIAVVTMYQINQLLFVKEAKLCRPRSTN